MRVQRVLNVVVSFFIMSLLSCGGSPLVGHAKSQIGYPVSKMINDSKLDVGKAELFQLTNGNKLYVVDSCAGRAKSPPEHSAHTTWYSSCTIYYEVNSGGIIVNAAVATPHFHKEESH